MTTIPTFSHPSIEKQVIECLASQTLATVIARGELASPCSVPLADNPYAESDRIQLFDTPLVAAYVHARNNSRILIGKPWLNESIEVRPFPIVHELAHAKAREKNVLNRCHASRAVVPAEHPIQSHPGATFLGHAVSGTIESMIESWVDLYAFPLMPEAAEKGFIRYIQFKQRWCIRVPKEYKKGEIFDELYVLFKTTEDRCWLRNLSQLTTEKCKIEIKNLISCYDKVRRNFCGSLIQRNRLREILQTIDTTDDENGYLDAIADLLRITLSGKIELSDY